MADEKDSLRVEWRERTRVRDHEGFNKAADRFMGADVKFGGRLKVGMALVQQRQASLESSLMSKRFRSRRGSHSGFWTC